MANNLPFDINGYKKFIRDNFLKSNQPKGKIGADAFSKAKKITPKAITSKGVSTVDEALELLFGNSAKGLGGGAIGKELGGLVKKAIPLGNPLVMGAMNIPIAVQNMKDIYGGESSKKNYEWAKAQMKQKGITPALAKAPVKKATPTTPKLKPANIPAGGNNNMVLPPLPNVAPAGSYPTYQEILKNAGVPIMDNFNPASPSQAGEYAPQGGGVPAGGANSLADRLGMGGYVDPEIPAGTELSTQRLQQIRDYLSRYSPEQYRDVLDQDAMGSLRNKSFANMFKNPALGEVPTELQKQADVLKYLQQGYDVDMGLATTARKLAQADAMSKATGLPSSWFEDPKDILTNIIRPQITSQGQIESYKQLGANQLGLGNLNNATKLSIAQMQNKLGEQKLQNQLAITKLIQEGKLNPAMIQALGGGAVNGQQLLDFIKQLRGGNNANYIPSQTDFGNTGDSF